MTEREISMIRACTKSRVLRTAAIPLATLLMSACSQGTGSTNDQLVIDNAVDADVATTADADDRADHLDELAGELQRQANGASNAAASGLRNEAARDVATAAAIRRRGQIDAAQSEEEIEANAGLLNQQ